MSEWKTVELCDVAKVTMGQSPSSTTYNESGIGLPFLQGCADFGSKYPIKKVYCSDPLKIVESGSALISVRAPVGTMNIANARFCIGRGLAGIQGISVHQDYLNYLISANTFKLDTVSQGSTFLAINSNDLNHLKLSIPTSGLAQRKIATILSTVDQVIEKTEAAIEKYKAIKAGMMQDLFTRGIDVKTGKLRPSFQEASELYEETELGWIPKEWDTDSLGHICEMRSGEGITSMSIDDFGNYPVYGGNGLRGYTSRYTHDGSYILIGRQGALCGNVNRVNGQFYASEHAVVVTVNDHTDVDWLSEVLDAMKLNDYSEASAQPGLAVSKILRLSISIPRHIEQRKIASVIQSLNKKVATEKALLSEYKQIKQGLMADLLTGKVRVKINENILEYS